MLDIQFIRDNQTAIRAAIRNKQIDVDLDRLLIVDDDRRRLIGQIDAARAQRRQLAAANRGADRQAATDIKTTVNQLNQQLKPVLAEYDDLIYKVPNLPTDDTPIGSEESDNQVLRQFGQIPEFDFTPKPHWDMVGFIDEPRAVRISGQRFAFIKGDLVRLQFAVLQFGLDVLTDELIIGEIIAANDLDVSSKPFLPILPPTMMRTDSYRATARLAPAEQTFKLANDDLWLTGSAEHSLCAYHMGETLDEADLPIRLLGYNTAYRREVGSAGRDTRGIIRQHQFDKLEMESFSHPDHSYTEHLLMVAIQEYLMEKLDQPFQTVLKCTADMGGPNRRGVDIETWMAGIGAYVETHSADYIGDFQSRGLQTFFRDRDRRRRLVHTNDATVFCQRPLVAIIENNQMADGRIRVPAVLVPYMKGQTHLKP